MIAPPPALIEYTPAFSESLPVGVTVPMSALTCAPDVPPAERPVTLTLSITALSAVPLWPDVTARPAR